MSKKRLIKSSIFSSCAIIALLLSIILVLGTISYGWFSDNTNVNANNMQITLNDQSYELSIPRSAGYSTDLTNYFSDYVTDLSTTSQNPNFFCLFEMEDDAETIEPGSYGKITFNIVSNSIVNQEFTFNINLRGIKETYNEDERVLSELSSNNTEEAKTLELLKGHIMLFATRQAISGGNTGPYYYQDYIVDVFSYSTEGITPTYQNGKYYYPVEIFWVWPLSFSQMVYPESDPRLNTNTLISDTDLRSDFIDYIGANPNKYFYWSSNQSISYTTGYEQSQSNYRILTEGYNNADQRIGDNIRFLAVEIIVN